MMTWKEIATLAALVRATPIVERRTIAPARILPGLVDRRKRITLRHMLKAMLTRM